jgi:hypothetical protein
VAAEEALAENTTVVATLDDARARKEAARQAEAGQAVWRAR